MELAPNAVVQPAPDLAVRSGAAVLIGGYPTRVLSLSTTGAAAVRSWFAGKPIGDKAAQRQLGWRLVDAGLADLQPRPCPAPPVAVTVVLPVKDDLTGLLRSLTYLARSVPTPAGDNEGPDPLPVVVVDDGSRQPVSHDDVVARLGRAAATNLRLTILKLASNQGPSAARNRGLELVETPLVAFVDANVSVSWEQLLRLAAELDEPNTVAVAPRVRPVSADQNHGLDAGSATAVQRVIVDYERRWCPLDMGQRPGIVGSGRPVPYVPTTCFMTTVAAMDDIGGFDEELRFGEDVDLVWRLAQYGWIRYIPTIEVIHPPRSDFAAFAYQRFRYGTAAAALARRHRRSMAPTKMAPTIAASLMGVLWRSPLLATAGAATGLRNLRRRLRPVPNPETETLLLYARGLRHSAMGLATATARVWWPVLGLAAIVWPPLRPRVLGLLAVGLGRRLRPGRWQSVVGDVALGAIDDGCYSLGVWTGVWRERDLSAVAPDIGRSAPRPDNIGDGMVSPTNG